MSKRQWGAILACLSVATVTFEGLPPERHTGVYVRYRTGEEEHYDLAKDPYELVNRARRPSASQMVKRLRRAAEELCSPPPPGLTF